MKHISGCNHHTGDCQYIGNDHSGGEIKDCQSSVFLAPLLRKHGIWEQKSHIDSDRSGRSTHHPHTLGIYDFSVVMHADPPVRSFQEWGETLRRLPQYTQVSNKSDKAPSRLKSSAEVEIFSTTPMKQSTIPATIPLSTHSYILIPTPSFP